VPFRSRVGPTIATALLLAALAVLYATHAFIGLEGSLRLPLPGGGIWFANAPVSDIVALILLPVALLRVWRDPDHRPEPPGWPGWMCLLGASLLSISHAADPAQATHYLLRKPVLSYLLYGVGLMWIVATLRRRWILQVIVISSLSLVASVSVLTSIMRIQSGDIVEIQAIAGLTPNHKTLAVCLAGWLPLLWSWARQRSSSQTLRHAAMTVSLVSLLAILLSMSRTAWLGSGLAAALFLPADRPLAWRPRRFIPAALLSVAMAWIAPVATHSATMIDATRSRQELNGRAWEMFAAHPLTGSGIGTSTSVQAGAAPYQDIKGVDAHGAIQKVASEAGLLGLLGLAWFLTGAGRTLIKSWRIEQRRCPDQPLASLQSYGCLATFAVLHAQLLLSTELFSPTHWVPLATAWGLSQAVVKNEDSCGS